MVRPSRKNRSVRTAINRVKREADGVYNKIAEISAKTGVQSGRFYEHGAEPGDIERVPLSDDEAQMVVFKAKAGIGPDVNLFASYRKPNAKRVGGKTRKDKAVRPILGRMPRSKGRLPTKGIGYKGTLNLTKLSDREARKIPKNAKMLAEEEGFKAFSVNNAWVRVHLTDNEGRTIITNVRRGVWNKAVAYQDELLGRRLPMGMRATVNMANAFKTKWYESDPAGSVIKEIHACEGLYKILMANNSDGEFNEQMRMLQDAIKTGDISIMKAVREYVTMEWDSMTWDEMLLYEDKYTNDAIERALAEDYI